MKYYFLLVTILEADLRYNNNINIVYNDTDDVVTNRRSSSFVSSNRILPFVYTFSGIFVELLKVIQSAGMC